ncbi:MAG TPA: hypothetical protein VFH27_17545, partial [Longimicrobiaceae bacterium]|nr:hypothetical protein [Longimicrobiaceae bacterium]
MPHARSEGARRLTRLMPFLLAVSPLPFSVTLGFVYAGICGRRRYWMWLGAGYSAATVASIVLASVHAIGFLAWMGVWFGGAMHALAIRGELGDRVDRMYDAALPAPVHPAVPAATGDAEMRPRCRYCGGLISGSHRECAGCGAPT